MKPATMILLCKGQLGLKPNTFTQMAISDSSLHFLVNAECELISEFGRWLNFAFSINSDLKYIKYSSRNQFFIKKH
jgi:hypothetical protein